jgi:hypothetical protein
MLTTDQIEALRRRAQASKDAGLRTEIHLGTKAARAERYSGNYSVSIRNADLQALIDEVLSHRKAAAA